MMLGSFLRSFDVQYTGSLKEGIFFSDEDFTKALRGIVKLHYSHGALYSTMNGNDFGPRLKKLVDERVRDSRAFAEELGVSLEYVQALMVEPLAVSNPSARLLERMSILLGESVGFLLGEKEKDDAIYRESKENFNAWVRESCDDVDARTRTRSSVMEGRLFRPQGRAAGLLAQRVRDGAKADWTGCSGSRNRNPIEAAIHVRYIGETCPAWIVRGKEGEGLAA
jgi:hypothetical protein